MIQGPIGSYESGQFQFWYSEKQAEGTEVVRANVIWFLDTEKIKKLNNGSLSMQKIDHYICNTCPGMLVLETPTF